MVRGKGLLAGMAIAAIGIAVGIPVGWVLAETSDRRVIERVEANKARVAIQSARAASIQQREKLARAAEQAIADREARVAREKRAAEENRIQEVRAKAAATMQRPQYASQTYLRDGDWKRLEELVDSLSTSRKRAPDGRYELANFAWGVSAVFRHPGDISDGQMQERLKAYQEQFPQSALAAILPAMQLHAAAWRARGGGYASSVTDRGWALFRERTLLAWDKISAVRSRGDRLPLWYEEAINIGIDAGIDANVLKALFDEGIRRFPGYHPIYRAYSRQLAPRWGGDYRDADEFVRHQVAAETNPEGEMMYALLYWQIDGHDGHRVEFFEQSRVDWRRMRAGFEILLEKYPADSNRSVFTVYACRSGDESTYLKLRRQVDEEDFENWAPPGISLEVCDAQFMTQT